MMLKSIIFEKFFRNDNKPLLDEEESSVASFVFEVAWCEIKTSRDTSDYESDDSEGYLVERLNKKVEAAAFIRFERVIEVLKKSLEARNDFLKYLEHLCLLFKKTIQELGDLAELQTDMFNKNRWQTIKGWIASKVPRRVITCIPQAITGISFAKGVASTPIKKVSNEVGKNLREVMSHLEKEKEKFSQMADWFSCLNVLKNAINPLLQRKVLIEIAQEVHRFQEEEANRQEMAGDEFQIRFKKVVGYCMRQMAKDGKLIKEYGDELAPAVATFIFVVCLMKDDNRFVLDCSLANQRLSSDLMSVLDFGVLTGEMIYGLDPRIGDGAIAQLDASSPIFSLFGIVFNQLDALQSFEEVDKQSVSEHAAIIKDVAEQFEQKLACIERVYNDTKDCKFQVDAVQWTTVLVNQVPPDAEVADLQMAVKQYLPDEDLYRVKVLKLPIEENSWVVQVPENRSRMLSQQTEMRIKGKNCPVNK